MNWYENEYMQIQNTRGNECCFKEAGRQRIKVNADWIRDGVGDSSDAALISWFCFALTPILTGRKVMKGNC